jgi:hypothetical protein
VGLFPLAAAKSSLSFETRGCSQMPKGQELDFSEEEVVLSFKFLDFNRHRDFDIWNLLGRPQEFGGEK